MILAETRTALRPIRFAVASAAIFLLALLWNSVVHLVVLREANASVQHLRRASATWQVWLALALTAAMACTFVSGYILSARTGTAREGLGYGVFFGVVAGLLVDLNQFVMFPIPATVALQWFAAGFLEFALYGLLVTRLYPLSPVPPGDRGVA